VCVGLLVVLYHKLLGVFITSNQPTKGESFFFTLLILSFNLFFFFFVLAAKHVKHTSSVCVFSKG
jgi:hypothetical protein